jgi:hypothetical protein
MYTRQRSVTAVLELLVLTVVSSQLAASVSQYGGCIGAGWRAAAVVGEGHALWGGGACAGGGGVHASTGSHK